MRKLVVNPIKCTGCRSCMLVCSFMHTDECSYYGSRIQIESQEGKGLHTPVLCRFCEDPACVRACPVEALSIQPSSGAILVDWGLCNGCQSCVSACPHKAMRFDKKTDKAFTCDLCQGDPECVKVCRLPQALVWARD